MSLRCVSLLISQAQVQFVLSLPLGEVIGDDSCWHLMIPGGPFSWFTSRSTKAGEAFGIDAFILTLLLAPPPNPHSVLHLSASSRLSSWSWFYSGCQRCKLRQPIYSRRQEAGHPLLWPLLLSRNLLPSRWGGLTEARSRLQAWRHPFHSVFSQIRHTFPLLLISFKNYRRISQYNLTNTSAYLLTLESGIQTIRRGCTHQTFLIPNTQWWLLAGQYLALGMVGTNKVRQDFHHALFEI